MENSDVEGVTTCRAQTSYFRKGTFAHNMTVVGSGKVSS